MNLKPVQRLDAEKNMQLSILGFAASVILTRFILEATGYPQLGNESLHIAHVLYGGVLLYAGSLLPLIFANRWAYTWSSVLSGIGIGLFIDEVGKFITQNNDYFFPAAAPIIYAFFLIAVLIYTMVVRNRKLDTRSEAYAVFESLGPALDHDLNPEEQIELNERLVRIKETSIDSDLGLISSQALDFVNSSVQKVDKKISPIEMVGRVTKRLLTTKRLRLFVIIGVFLFGFGGTLRLVYYTVGSTSLDYMLFQRVSQLPVDTEVAVFWAGVQLVLEGLAGVLMLGGSIMLILGKERRGWVLSTTGLVISLVGVTLIQFYIDQFGTITKAFIQFLLLNAMYSYQRVQTGLESTK